MILINTPKTPTQLDTLARTRRIAEGMGFFFNDLTLEMEVLASKSALAGMDIIGHIVHDSLAKFAAVIMSATDYTDLEEGHTWLHQWLDSNALEGGCRGAKKDALEVMHFVLGCDTLNEVVTTYRVTLAEKAGLAEKFEKISAELEKVIENDLPADGEAYFSILLDEMEATLTMYQTPENGIEKVLKLGSALRGISEIKTLLLYINNSMIAINYGVVGEGFADAIKGTAFAEHFKMDALVGSAEQMRAKFAADETHSGHDRDRSFEQFKAMFEAFGDEDDDE